MKAYSVLALAVCAMPMPAGALRAADASRWSDNKGAAIRLLSGDALSTDERRAGLEIKLKPGWKTYWRMPGDSGVPPIFDWSRSDNVAEVTVLWPAPQAFDDGGGTSIGYKHDVILPLHVRPKDPQKPSILNLSLDFAVCETICVPVKGEASLDLAPAGKTSVANAALIAAQETQVPLAQALGANAPLAVTAVHFDAKTKPPRLVIEVRSASEPSLFVEGRADWVLPMPVAAPPPAGSLASHAFRLDLAGLPKGAVLSGAALRLTLVARDGAVETLYNLP
jgi:DsbC/DsbD-like thiol-disulfide interchange protein